MCTGRRCIVVGSAPGVELPKAEHNDVILAANGGAAVVRAAGREVDVLVTTSHLFAGTTELDRATLESLRDLRVGSAWVDTKNGLLTHMRVQAMDYALEAKDYINVTPHLRNKIAEEALGFTRWMSTGVWAACLAVASRASNVVLCGVSMQAGHAGMPWDHQARHHMNEDAVCLRALGPLGVEMPFELVEAVT